MLLIILLSLLFSSAMGQQIDAVAQIHVGPGTEDMVLDTFDGQHRLLISCNQRRKGLPHFGEIVSFDLNSSQKDTLERVNEPKGFSFNPHGIDLVKNSSGELLLYVVNHSPIADAKVKQNSIMLYRVDKDRLTFQQQYLDGSLISPNDVTASPKGWIYATNDSKHRKIGFSWLMERMFKVRSSTIAFYDPDAKKWAKQKVHLAYANGIALTGDTLLVAATQRKHLVKFDVSNGGLQEMKRWKIADGLDNISLADSRHVLIAAHPKAGKFIKHAKNASALSPGIIYGVDLTNGNTSIIYTTNGKAISGNSVALFANEAIFVGQVFEDHILKLNIPKK
ncbi:MAG: hypothetical protein SFW35_09210 [Chitinophagales bacterium]|nr:hypothetical protein [Chitinophagales bacterium]